MQETSTDLRRMCGERLARVRRTLAVRQEDVGDLLGVTRKTVQNWESGKCPIWIERLHALESFGINGRAFVSGISEDMWLESYDDAKAAIDTAIEKHGNAVHAQ